MRKCAVIIAVAVLLLSFGCRNSGDVLLLYPIGNDERINAVGQQLGFEGGNGEQKTPFVLTGNDQLEKLREHVATGFWEKYDENSSVIRFATSWATRKEDVDALIEML